MANVNDILQRVYGAKGLPFPSSVNQTSQSFIAADFTGTNDLRVTSERSKLGTRYWGVNELGRPVFMPAQLDDVELQNPVISMSGEHNIIETDVYEVGTVFEKVYQKPWEISIICTLLNAEGTWPEAQVQQMLKAFEKGGLYTLKCALTDILLQARENFILTQISILDMQGIENAQVIQLNGKSNRDFELVIK